jgi:hypothetical protein
VDIRTTTTAARRVVTRKISNRQPANLLLSPPLGVLGVFTDTLQVRSFARPQQKIALCGKRSQQYCKN